MIFYPAISRKFQRKRLLGILQNVAIVGYMTMLLAGLFMPSGMMLKFYIMTVGYMLANFGQYGFYLVMMISIINTVEYNEHKHGERAEAIISSLRPFLTKLGSALCVALTSATYLIFKVTGITNGISAAENTAAMDATFNKEQAIGNLLSNVQKSQSIGLLLAMTLVPLAFMLAAFFLYRAKYKLDEPEYERICQELENRRSLVNE